MKKVVAATLALMYNGQKRKPEMGIITLLIIAIYHLP